MNDVTTQAGEHQARRGTPFSVGAATGRAFVDLPADVRGHLLAWLEAGTVADGEPIKPGRVYARGDWIIKIFEPGQRLRDRLRPSPALRCARAHAGLNAVRTPRPIVALEFPGGRSLVVIERIDGRTLDVVLAAEQAEPPAASETSGVAAFVRMMVAMHRARVFHGDLHPDQVLWDGRDWYLLDLDGLRHPLRALNRRGVIELQWARLCRSIPPAQLQPLFSRYLELAQWGWDPVDAWRRVLSRAARLQRVVERSKSGSAPANPDAFEPTGEPENRSLSA